MRGFPPQFLSLCLGALLVSTGVAGCASRSVQERRIEKNPELYARLDSRERELVNRGEVTEGMSRDAVFLAWGRPDLVRSGSREGEETEKWAWLEGYPTRQVTIGVGTPGYHPFYDHYGVHPAFGYGYGPGWGVGTGLDVMPLLRRSVEFRNGRVIAWERRG